MQEQKNIIDCYDKTASEYANQFGGELEHKHLDLILLRTFANENAKRGKMIDLGCGPGQTTKFLFDSGVKDILGTDLSAQMISVAESINPNLNFEKADMLKLHYPEKSFGSAIAFYSIVHFDYTQIKKAFEEIKRILSDDAQFIFSFHVGDKTIHLDEFLNQKVDIDFYFFEVDRIVTLLNETGFKIVDIIERQPYPDVEHQSRRAYIWARSGDRQ